MGEHFCTDGAWGPCDPPAIGQVYSNQFAHCGAECGSCSTASDNCTDGRCGCGDAGPCTRTKVPCCDAVCRPNDVNNCGACGQVCPTPPHANPFCSNGSCGFSCQANYGDCTTSSPGCETSLASNSNCGACGKVCSGSYSCSSEAGGYKCCAWFGYPSTYQCI